jgi:hypothetical protein
VNSFGKIHNTRAFLVASQIIKCVHCLVSVPIVVKLMASPGTYHLVDNFSKSLLDCLTTWVEMKDKFASVLSFFHAPHNRDLYKAALLHPFVHFLMHTGPPSFDGGLGSKKLYTAIPPPRWLCTQLEAHTMVYRFCWEFTAEPMLHPLCTATLIL